MRKNKFTLDQKEPSSEEIGNKADFDGIKDRFIEGKGVQRFKKWVVAAVAGLIVVLGSLFVFYPSDSEMVEYNRDADKQIEQTVVAELPSVPQEIYQIDPKEELDIFTQNGSIIHIPKNAFLNRENKLVEENIELVYTEFDDPVSIFLSGISMNYDSAGTRYGFQTGGMFSLEAKAQNEVLHLADGKEISVYHTTELKEEKLNVYTKSNPKDNWKYEMQSQIMSFEEACEELTITFDHKDKDLAAQVNSKSKKREDLNQRLEHSRSEEILEPHRVDNENYTFDLDIDPVEFPELKSFQTLKFEVIDPSFRYPMFHVTYDDIRLKKADDGSYKVHLYKESEKTILNVYPLLSEAEIVILEKEYEEKLAEKLRMEEEMEGEVYMMEEWLEESRRALDKDLAISSSRRLVNEMRSALIADRPVRKFMLSDLSIVNHDCPYEVPNGSFKTHASFKMGDEEILLDNVTLVNLKKNAYIDYLEKDFHAFTYERNKKHIGMTSLKDGTFALIIPEELNSVDKDAVANSFQVIAMDSNQDCAGLKEEVYSLLGQ